MFRRRRPVMLALLVTVIGCDSYRPPTAPPAPVNPESQPPPEPGPLPVPVPAANVVLLAAPASPPSSATDPIVGRYALEIVVAADSDPFCEAVPPYAKRRTYTADIEDLGDRYAVKLYDASFLRDASSVGFGCRDRRLAMGGICHQFLMTRDGSSTVSVTIVPEDEWRGSEIWEVLPDGYLLQIHGHATGAVGDERIEVAGSGGVWYGNGIPASNVAACNGNLHLTFTRR